MFEILSVQKKSEQEKLAEICETPYFPDCMAYKLLVEGSFTGLCQFTIEKDGAHLKSLGLVSSFNGNADGTRDEYCSALCRTALSFLESIGVRTAFSDCAFENDRILYMSGFGKNGSGLPSADLTAVFKTCPSSGEGR